MEEILELTKIDFPSLFISVFVILIGIKAIISLLEWVISKLGLETKWMRKKREDHELLVKTSQNLNALQERHIKDMEESDKHDAEMRNDIKKLTDMFIDKEINDMRWEINNFANKVSEGRPCNKDSFKHCIHTYEKYEKIIAEEGLTNGEVEISMQIINDYYKQKLKEGF